MIGCLCIHGFTGGPYEVEPLAAYLQEKSNWTVVVCSLPGHGEELQLKSVTFNQWIDEAETELTNLISICDKVYVVGFSMGGMIASYLAAKYQVSKIVLLSPSRRYISIRQMAVDMGSFIKQGVKGKLKENKLFQHYRKKRGSVPIQALVEFVKCMKFIKPNLKDIDCPVLIAQGLQDGMVPYQSAHYLDEEIPANTEVIFFYDSKHHICLGSDKDVLFQRVFDFLIK